MLVTEEDKELPLLSVVEVRNLTLLTEMPFVVPFQDRVKVGHRLSYRTGNISGSSFFNPLTPNGRS